MIFSLNVNRPRDHQFDLTLLHQIFPGETSALLLRVPDFISFQTFFLVQNSFAFEKVPVTSGRLVIFLVLKAVPSFMRVIDLIFLEKRKTGLPTLQSNRTVSWIVHLEQEITHFQAFFCYCNVSKGRGDMKGLDWCPTLWMNWKAFLSGEEGGAETLVETKQSFQHFPLKFKYPPQNTDLLTLYSCSLRAQCFLIFW